MARIRRSPGSEARATSTTTTIAASDSTGTATDFDLDQALAGDRSVWSAVYAGEFRLAVRCKRCGRWLTAGASKAARLGAHCAARAVTE